MATYNRFTSTKKKPLPGARSVDDDAEYEEIARKRIAATQPAPRPTRPTTPATMGSGGALSSGRPTALATVDDDDDDDVYRMAANARLGATTPPTRATTATRRTGPATTQQQQQQQQTNRRASVTSGQPEARSGTTQANALPLQNTATRNAANTSQADLRAQAIKRMDEEDAKGGLINSGSGGARGGMGALDALNPNRKGQREDTGGITVIGNGNREETGEDPVSLTDYVNDRYGNGDSDTRNDMQDAVTEEMLDRERRDNVGGDGGGGGVGGVGGAGGGNLGDATTGGDKGVEYDEDDVNVIVGQHQADEERKRDDDDLADVARKRLEAEQKRERDAMQAELAAGKAKALMMANARAQLAGMGLSGSTATLESDIARTADRSNTLTMSQVGRTQRDEGRDDRRLTAQERAAAANERRAQTNDEWQMLQRKLAVGMLEDEGDLDLNNDNMVNGQPVGGNVGDGDPYNNEPDPNAPSDPTQQADFDPDEWKEEDGEMRERTQQGQPWMGDRYIGSDGTYDYWIGGIGGTKFVVKHHGEPYSG